jgi:hypothetical protein
VVRGRACPARGRAWHASRVGWPARGRAWHASRPDGRREGVRVQREGVRGTRAGRMPGARACVAREPVGCPARGRACHASRSDARREGVRATRAGWMSGARACVPREPVGCPARGHACHASRLVLAPLTSRPLGSSYPPGGHPENEASSRSHLDWLTVPCPGAGCRGVRRRERAPRRRLVIADAELRRRRAPLHLHEVLRWQLRLRPLGHRRRPVHRRDLRRLTHEDSEPSATASPNRLPHPRNLPPPPTKIVLPVTRNASSPVITYRDHEIEASAEWFGTLRARASAQRGKAPS